ncbi:hypothetical protein CRYUN_Cryun39dG0069900 [Craigia yunnanensis]
MLDACCQNIASTDEIRQYVVEMSVLIVTCIQRDNPRSSWLSGVLINSDLFAMLLSGLIGFALHSCLVISLETETEAEKTGTETDGSSTASQSAGDTEHVSKPNGVSVTITTALANAEYTLEGSEVELALNLLRLAFETKNLKILEPALDCLHGDPGLDGGKNAPLFIYILNMVCSCVDNSSPDRHMPLCLLTLFIAYVPCYACLILENNLQYNPASAVGTSYYCSIHKVQSPWGTFGWSYQTLLQYCSTARAL